MNQNNRPLHVTTLQEETLPYLNSEEVPTLDAKQIRIFERVSHERFVREVLTDQCQVMLRYQFDMVG